MSFATLLPRFFNVTPNPPQGWRPSVLPQNHGSFLARPADEQLREGCKRLRLVPVGASKRNYFDTGLCSIAMDERDALYWVKVSAVRGTPVNDRREREEAVPVLAGVSKPLFVNKCEWVHEDLYWRALQTTASSSPAVETSYWAGSNAEAVSDDWIAQLKSTLKAITFAPRRYHRFTADELTRLIVRRFGPDAPHFANEWQVVHGDVNWSNLTAPNLVLLDWESWGLGPRGFDAAELVAFSCHRPAIAQRLEAAFAEDLQSQSGRVAWLAMLAIILDMVDSRHMHSCYRRPVKQMARRVINMRPASRRMN